MKFSKLWFVLLVGLLLGAACNDTAPKGGGTLPEHGAELIAEYVSDSMKDESGGRIMYIKDVPSEQPGENLWCVNVRFINSNGITTAPIMVSQRGEEWRLDKTPNRTEYETQGCVWPVSDEN